MTAPTADAAPVLALIQAAGLPGFRSSEPGAEPLNAAGRGVTGSVDPILALIQAAGLSGFVQRNYGSTVAALSPSAVAMPTHAPTPSAFSPPAVAIENATLTMSTQKYFVLEIDRGAGEASLAAIESESGIKMGDIYSKGTVYSSRNTAAGTERAFSFNTDQHRDLQLIATKMGSNGLRARIGAIPLQCFVRTDLRKDVGPPQISPKAVAALKAALR